MLFGLSNHVILHRLASMNDRNLRRRLFRLYAELCLRGSFERTAIFLSTGIAFNVPRPRRRIFKSGVKEPRLGKRFFFCGDFFEFSSC